MIRLIIGIALIAGIIMISGRAFSQELSSTDLIDNSRQLDGKTVTYAGEVIGEVMARGDNAWVNVNDGVNAIGVWMPRAIAEQIQFGGNYKQRGDWVEITGVLHRACFEHGGDLDMHASYFKMVRPGRQINHRLNILKAYQALVLLGVLLLIWILSQLKLRPKKK
jgi:hypothetical protein